MNKIILVLLALGTVYGCGNKTTKDGRTLSIYHIEEYCGGAAPPDEMMEELQKPKPLNATLYLHTDMDPMRENESVEIELKHGKADISNLAPGTYMVFKEHKLNRDSVEGDPATFNCRLEFNTQPYFMFKVSTDSTLVTDTILTSCDPCIPPMP